MQLFSGKKKRKAILVWSRICISAPSTAWHGRTCTRADHLPTVMYWTKDKWCLSGTLKHTF